MELFKRIWLDDEGQDLVEYALLAALLSIATIATLTTLGTTIGTAWSTLSTAISNAL